MEHGMLATTRSKRWKNNRPMSRSTSNSIVNLLSPEDILLDVEVSSKGQLFDEVGWHMARLHAMPEESVARSLSRREQVGSTGLGLGVAVPHARINGLEQIQVAYVSHPGRS